MELIIDANVVISALVTGKGKTAELLFSNSLVFFAPEFLFEEVKKYEREICFKSGLSSKEFAVALALIFPRITLIPLSEFKQCISEAKLICPDANDVLYFALALYNNCSIWSNDKRLQKQNHIKIMTTANLLESRL